MENGLEGRVAAGRPVRRPLQDSGGEELALCPGVLHWRCSQVDRSGCIWEVLLAEPGVACVGREGWVRGAFQGRRVGVYHLVRSEGLGCQPGALLSIN